MSKKINYIQSTQLCRRISGQT